MPYNNTKTRQLITEHNLCSWEFDQITWKTWFPILSKYCLWRTLVFLIPTTYMYHLCVESELCSTDKVLTRYKYFWFPFSLKKQLSMMSKSLILTFSWGIVMKSVDNVDFEKKIVISNWLNIFFYRNYEYACLIPTTSRVCSSIKRLKFLFHSN